jgi:soluble lytic murein transglycosylase-like protein
MKMRKHNILLSIAIGTVLGTAIGTYAVSQQEIACKPYIEVVCAADLAEEIPVWEAPAEVIEEVVVEEVKYFDVPLSEELQEHIFAECEKYGIAPAIVVSMIAQESNYRPLAVGDGGDSQGLLQIQRKWHEERMERLGCTDLLDPFQNVTVAVDYLAELKEIDNDVCWVLMCYNGGKAYADKNVKAGKISTYALEVTERAAELEKNTYER